MRWHTHYFTNFFSSLKWQINHFFQKISQWSNEWNQEFSMRTLLVFLLLLSRIVKRTRDLEFKSWLCHLSAVTQSILPLWTSDSFVKCIYQLHKFVGTLNRLLTISVNPFFLCDKTTPCPYFISPISSIHHHPDWIVLLRWSQNINTARGLNTIWFNSFTLKMAQRDQDSWASALFLLYDVWFLFW